MGVKRNRVDTLRALAAGAKSRAGSTAFDLIDLELQHISSATRVSPEWRKNLLQVFHGMRALETGMKEVVRSHGQIPKSSLGSLLYQMNGFGPGHPCYIDSGTLGRFLGTVRPQRNRIMHEANAYPTTNRETERIMGDVASCFCFFVK